MQLTVRDLARIMQVPEKTVLRWIQKEGLPAYQVNDQYRLNRAEVLEWATACNLSIPSDLFRSQPGEADALPTLADALRKGGVFYGVEGRDQETILRAVVQRMRLPESVDREQMFRMLLAREAMESTAVGDGVAIPHPRNPIVLRVPEPLITLCFLEQPADYGALDGQPVFALFSLISPTPRIHLHMLARLFFSLRQPDFRSLVVHRASEALILETAARMESLMKKPATGGVEAAP